MGQEGGETLLYSLTVPKRLLPLIGMLSLLFYDLIRFNILFADSDWTLRLESFQMVFTYAFMGHALGELGWTLINLARFGILSRLLLVGLLGYCIYGLFWAHATEYFALREMRGISSYVLSFEPFVFQLALASWFRVQEHGSLPIWQTALLVLSGIGQSFDSLGGAVEVQPHGGLPTSAMLMAMGSHLGSCVVMLGCVGGCFRFALTLTSPRSCLERVARLAPAAGGVGIGVDLLGVLIYAAVFLRWTMGDIRGYAPWTWAPMAIYAEAASAPWVLYACAISLLMLWFGSTFDGSACGSAARRGLLALAVFVPLVFVGIEAGHVEETQNFQRRLLTPMVHSLFFDTAQTAMIHAAVRSQVVHDGSAFWRVAQWPTLGLLYVVHLGRQAMFLDATFLHLPATATLWPYLNFQWLPSLFGYTDAGAFFAAHWPPLVPNDLQSALWFFFTPCVLFVKSAAAFCCGHRVLLIGFYTADYGAPPAAML